MYLCTYVMIGHYFNKHRALATGIASCGSGVGTFVFNPMTLSLIDIYGWKGCMLILSGIVLNGVVIGATFRSIPTITDQPGEGDDAQPRKKQKLIDLSLLTNIPFIVFSLSSFLCLVGKFVFVLFL